MSDDLSKLRDLWVRRRQTLQALLDSPRETGDELIDTAICDVARAHVSALSAVIMDVDRALGLAVYQDQAA